LREEHETAAIPGVGHHAANQREDDNRTHAGEAHKPQGKTLLLRRHEQRHVPEKRRILHHRTGHRKDESYPKEAKIAVTEGDN